MFVNLPRDVIRNSAHFRLRVHTLRFETATYNQSNSPTCDLCDTDDVRDEQHVLFHCANRYVISLHLSTGNMHLCSGSPNRSPRCAQSLKPCHAKSVAWTNHVISPGIYNVSNCFTFIWLSGQFRWSSCNKPALFSDLSDSHLLSGLLEPSLPSRVEREET